MAELTNLDGLKTVIHPSAGLYLPNGTSESGQSWFLDALNGKIYSRFFDGDTQLIELPDFDWCEGHPHRSWWGEIQRLSFLSWYVSSRVLFDEDKKRHSIIFTKKALLNWIDKASDNKKSPLAWHDHSSALRLINIINWLSSIAIEETYTDLINDAEVIKIIDSISRHVEFLLDEKFYTRHTNHGFDQALALYTSALIWGGGDIFAGANEVATARLFDEISFAFTDQGVHTENSPVYHKFMHKRLGQIIKLEVFGRSRLIEHCEKLRSKTIIFFSAITLPDNTLPLIGDTVSVKGFPKNTLPDFEVFDYSESGYVIAKGLSDSGEPFHFIFKNAHQSGYHRHDDDLSFHLYFNGTVVFADGGPYSLDEKNPIRQFLRSTYAHNTVFPLHGKMVRAPKKLKRKPVCQLPKPREVWGVSAAGGRGLTRSIDFSKLAAGELTIRGRYVSIREDQAPLVVNFFMPACQSSSFEGKSCTLDFENCRVSILSEETINADSLYEGIGDNGEVHAVISHAHEKHEDAARLTLQYDAAGGRCITHRILISNQ